ncbi:hypothetical protein VH86_13430 [Pantoea sp. BL1]|nr:hypothetical protein VH86_13430 [Pantoea sp. BL1]
MSELISIMFFCTSNGFIQSEYKNYVTFSYGIIKRLFVKIIVIPDIFLIMISICWVIMESYKYLSYGISW